MFAISRLVLPLLISVSFLAPPAQAQSDDYGPPFPVVPNGGTYTHNGWTLGNAANQDFTNVYTIPHEHTFAIDGQVVLRYKVRERYSTGPEAVQIWAAEGWSLQVGPKFIQTWGRSASMPESEWHVGATVTFIEETFWGIDLAAKHVESNPYGGTTTTTYGLSGHDWYWTKGRQVTLDIQQEPSNW